jgi:hypothetical protein
MLSNDNKTDQRSLLERIYDQNQDVVGQRKNFSLQVSNTIRS